MSWKLIPANLELAWPVLLKWQMYLNGNDLWPRHEIYWLIIVFPCKFVSKVSLGMLCTSLIALFICNEETHFCSWSWLRTSEGFATEDVYVARKSLYDLKDMRSYNRDPFWAPWLRVCHVHVSGSKSVRVGAQSGP